MGTTFLDRRQLLKGLGAGAVVAGAAVTVSPAIALAGDDGNGVIGGWEFKVHSAQLGEVDGVFTFGPGGVLAEEDALSPGSSLGVWRHLEGRKFLWKFKGFDVTQTPPAVAVVSGDLTVNRDSMHGTFTGRINGVVVATGTFDGTRMAV